jgi:hypothetical protein
VKLTNPLIAVILLIGLSSLNADTRRDHASNAFDKLKSLVGEWQGTTANGVQTANFELVADSSVLASRLSGGMPHDMHTMIHLDGGSLMLTHYCAMHNQPRMTLVPGGDANVLVFKFKDGTNLGGGGGHMNRVIFTLDGPDHHIEEWTFLANGHETTNRSEFRRKHS